jgi:hypothetical protein
MNKKGSKKSQVKRRASSPEESVLKLKKIISTQAQEIREGAEQQKATSAILRVIASSPTDIQPVLDALAESPARLCEVTDAQINRLRVRSFVGWPLMDQCLRPTTLVGGGLSTGAMWVAEPSSIGKRSTSTTFRLQQPNSRGL